MIKLLLKLTHAFTFQLCWLLFALVVMLYMLLFEIDDLKEAIQEVGIKDYVLNNITLVDIEDDQILYVKGEWKTIWHWALNIK